MFFRVSDGVGDLYGWLAGCVNVACLVLVCIFSSCCFFGFSRVWSMIRGRGGNIYGKLLPFKKRQQREKKENHSHVGLIQHRAK